MTMTLLLFAAAFLAILMLGASATSPAMRPTPGRTTPIDEAERILAGRYARGEISYEEYGRMVSVLRR